MPLIPRLHLESAEFPVGTPVSGSVELRTDGEGLRPKAVHVSLVRRVLGGDRPREEVVSSATLPGVYVAPHEPASAPFVLPTGDACPTWPGALVAVQWCLRVRIDAPGADPRLEQAVTLVRRPIRPAATGDDTVVEQRAGDPEAPACVLKATGAFAVLLVVVGVVLMALVGTGLVAVDGPAWPAWLVGGGVAAVGLGTLRPVRRRLRAARRLGPVAVALRPAVARPGIVLHAAIVLHPPEPLVVQGIEVALIGTETVLREEGPRMAEQERRFERVLRRPVRDTVLPAGEDTRLEVPLQVPFDAPPSLAVGGCSLAWSLVVTVRPGSGEPIVVAVPVEMRG